MEDKELEKLLGIKTTGRDDTRADSYNYPYEPTDYCVLKRLAESGYIGKKNHLIDYGCGKGRVSFYFFNPFSVEVLGSVVKKIVDSFYEKEREMLLFFYYPSDEYVAKLMTNEVLSFVDEIDCEDLFANSKEAQRERILIFKVGE